MNLFEEIILVDQHLIHCIEYVNPFDSLWIYGLIPQ